MAFASHSVTPPKNGACRIERNHALDLQFLAALADGVQSAARAQDFAGEELDAGTLERAESPLAWRAIVRRGRLAIVEPASGAWSP